MKTIDNGKYMDYLKNYVKLFDDVNLNKIDKNLALEKIERYKCDIAVSNTNLLIDYVGNNVEVFMQLSMGFASCYMLLKIIIDDYKAEQNIDMFMKNAHKLKDYIEYMV